MDYDNETPLFFYVATAWGNRANARKAMAALENLENGNCMMRSCDWTTHTMEEFDRDRQGLCMEDFNGVVNADVLIILLPVNAGAYTELGIALALDKPVILWAEKEEDFLTPAGYENIFYSHPNVQRKICPFDEFISLISASGLEAFEI